MATDEPLGATSIAAVTDQLPRTSPSLLSAPKPNHKYDHVYAIVRLDLFLSDPPVMKETAVTVQKVVWDQKVAEAEVTRLNQVNKDKKCRYFWQLTRIEHERPEVVSPPNSRVKRTF